MTHAAPLHVAIMAAGKGTRMRSAVPKVLHPLAGRTLLGHVIAALAPLQPQQTLVIVGHQHEAVTAALPAGATAVRQEPQLGTGHALMQVKPVLPPDSGTLLLLSGDVPLIRPETLTRLVAHHQEQQAAATILTTRMPVPGHLGRILRGPGEAVEAIVEAKDAKPEQLMIDEINAGIYCFDWAKVSPLLAQLQPNNAQGEYYLTDVIAMLVAAGEPVRAVITPDWTEVMGINDRVELAAAGTVLQTRINTGWMQAGVSLIDPATTYIDATVRFEGEATVWPGCLIQGGSVIGDGAEIGPQSQIRDSLIGARTLVRQSVIDQSRIGAGTQVGPFAHLRQHADVGADCRIGNFVELKKTVFADKAKASHLSYLGDATVGTGANIGAGTITCNYDGAKKHPTTIGERVFVGSNSVLVAPVTLQADSYIAAGSVITQDVPTGALGVGRGRQANIEGWVWRRRGQES
ncbi:MAG: bifunctional UDP-N-acetylglucosamine diphosphorylase/glucosamine-1-phosphate N-acetyltransferase GlmU [Candidatus Sericytochromatia bacterium]|nr:bifunctional UDP-N-acetylglucosamine diphosphorylase/glucosamine-1-phosphate N-acetyltransferase GlmU [Candidatus Sericytochromatia bacterium]